MQLSDVNLTDLDTFEKGTPHDQFRLLRREAPVFWHEETDGGKGFWAITKYDDLKWISKSPHLFSSARQGTLRQDPTPESLPLLQKIILNMDPPKHRQYRALVNKAFTPRMVNGMLPRVRDCVKRIVNGVIEKGECDFVEEVAAILPMEVICDMMGVPNEDRRHVYQLGNSMVGFDDPELQEDGVPRKPTGSAQEGFAEMFVYANHLLEKAKNHPSDDLATALVNAEIDGERLSDEDFRFFFLVLLIAGNETTRTVTTNGMIALLENPDQLDAVKSDLSLVNSTVEEVLRYNPAVHAFRREVTEELEIRGQKVAPDDKLMLWYSSANRDEDAFDEPDKFDVRRHPNDHLAFGVGEHFCLGANLARMELREIFRGVLSRIGDMEMTAAPRRLRSTFINGVKEMRVKFRPGPLEA
jgi:cholest-4-en-3-one 26-monooxygenase